MKNEDKQKIAKLTKNANVKILQLISRIEYLIDITPDNKPLIFNGIGIDVFGYQEEWDVERFVKWEIIKFQDPNKRYSFNPFIVNIEKLSELKKLLGNVIEIENINSEKSSVESNFSSISKKIDFSKWWQVEKTGKSGKLTYPDKRSDLFKGSYFGGLNILILNWNGFVTRKDLQEKIAKFIYGKRKPSSEIDISQWKNRLYRNHPNFKKYLKIQLNSPDSYSIFCKDTC